MDSLQAQTLYTRFFDVTLDNHNTPNPSAMANFSKNLPEQAIIPVVYITKEAINKMPWPKLDFYARNISKLIKQKADSIHIHPKEIQMDMDWNAGNRDIYFALLEKIKAQPYLQNKTLGATIRLHQVKYKDKTGVPPVDKGLLMVYNMDDLTDYAVENSILTLETTKDYLETVDDYPLSLDIALPIYSWTLLFKADGFSGILRNIQEKDLQNNPLFTKKEKNRYLITRDTIFKGYPLQNGQYLRHEKADFKSVDQVARYLSDKITADSLNILLYQSDSLNFQEFTYENMETIFTDFE